MRGVHVKTARKEHGAHIACTCTQAGLGLSTLGCMCAESRARPHAYNRKYRVPASENLSSTAAVRHLIDPFDARLTYTLFLVAFVLEFVLPILFCFEVLFPGDSLGPILGESMLESIEAFKFHGVLNMAKGQSCPDTRTQSKCALAPLHHLSFLATPQTMAERRVLTTHQAAKISSGVFSVDAARILFRAVLKVKLLKRFSLLYAQRTLKRERGRGRGDSGQGQVSKTGGKENRLQKFFLSRSLYVALVPLSTVGLARTPASERCVEQEHPQQPRQQEHQRKVTQGGDQHAGERDGWEPLHGRPPALLEAARSVDEGPGSRVHNS